MTNEQIIFIIGVALSLVTTLIGAWSGYSLAIRRFRKEELFRIRSELYRKQLNAYQRLYLILGQANFQEPDGTGVVLRVPVVPGDPGVQPKQKYRYYIHPERVRKLILEIRAFLLSESGLLIRRRTRKAFYGDVWPALEEVLAEIDQAKIVPDKPGWYLVTRKQAQRIENGFAWMRRLIRGDIGLEDLSFPAKELKEWD